MPFIILVITVKTQLLWVLEPFEKGDEDDGGFTNPKVAIERLAREMNQDRYENGKGVCVNVSFLGISSPSQSPHLGLILYIIIKALAI